MALGRGGRPTVSREEQRRKRAKRDQALHEAKILEKKKELIRVNVDVSKLDLDTLEDREGGIAWGECYRVRRRDQSSRWTTRLIADRETNY